jgi:hypothetical protein
MSYLSIAACVTDADFVNRVRACVGDEGHDVNRIDTQLFYDVATANDIEAAYASALAAENPRPGADEAVITDGMILSSVQANWSEIPPP